MDKSTVITGCEGSITFGRGLWDAVHRCWSFFWLIDSWLKMLVHLFGANILNKQLRSRACSSQHWRKIHIFNDYNWKNSNFAEDWNLIRGLGTVSSHKPNLFNCWSTVSSFFSQFHSSYCQSVIGLLRGKRVHSLRGYGPKYSLSGSFSILAKIMRTGEHSMFPREVRGGGPCWRSWHGIEFETAQCMLSDKKWSKPESRAWSARKLRAYTPYSSNREWIPIVIWERFGERVWGSIGNVDAQIWKYITSV